MPKQRERSREAEPEPQVKMVTKPARPHSFKFRDINDPALIRLLQQKGITLATVRYSLARDGSSLGEQVYWPAAALAVATGLKTPAIAKWRREKRFIPATKLLGQHVWAAEDVAYLLKHNDFPAQRITDQGHIGDIAQRAAHALGDVLDERGNPIEPGQTPAGGSRKRGGKSGVPDPLAMLRL